MEQQQSWEQPMVTDDVQVAEAAQQQGISSSEQNGSQLGKFKDTDALLSAYNSLQAEFTKKCQKLSELEKQKEQKAEDLTPIFMNENWSDKVTEFLTQNQEAKNYASEISEYIIKNPNMAKNDNALEIAWANVVQKNYVSPEKLVGDEAFVDKYIMSNADIKQKILNEYIKQIQTTTPPPVISTKSGGSIAFATQKQPLSLSEAKSLVEEIFNTKGD